MRPDLIARYQIGGDIYESLESEFGQTVANQAAAAAATGDNLAVNRVLSNARATVRTGALVLDANFDTRGTGRLLLDQLTSDPLGAPLDAANRQLSTLAGNTASAFLRNPMVLLVIAVIGFGVWVNVFGLPKFLKGSH